MNESVALVSTRTLVTEPWTRMVPLITEKLVTCSASNAYTQPWVLCCCYCPPLAGPAAENRKHPVSAVHTEDGNQGWYDDDRYAGAEAAEDTKAVGIIL